MNQRVDAMYTDEDFLRMAFSLARRGEGETSPNPIVGALVVKDGKVIGKGFHRKAGEKHAEIAALEQAGGAAKDATLYLNLEPCCHYGKTPPCCARIIEAGIKRVVCSMRDPNPLVNGKGIENLRASGIAMKEGILEEEARRLNEAFVKVMTSGKPFVIAKAAMSVDGKIAAANGESQWISSPESRKYIHNRIRYCVDAIIAGINTVLLDDPLLTVRGTLNRKRKIVRVILDSLLRTPPNSKVLSSAEEGEVWIYTTAEGNGESKKKLEGAGARVITVAAEHGRCSTKGVFDDLGRRGIASVLIEGGSQILASAFREKLVDKVYFFIAPSIMGGGGSISSIGELGMRSLSQAIKFSRYEAIPVDRDIMYRAYPRYG